MKILKNMCIEFGKYENQYQFGISFGFHKHSPLEKYHFHTWLEIGKYYFQLNIGK